MLLKKLQEYHLTSLSAPVHLLKSGIYEGSPIDRKVTTVALFLLTLPNNFGKLAIYEYTGWLVVHWT